MTKYDRVRRAITTDPAIPESRSPNRRSAGIGHNKVENSDRCFPYLRSRWRRRRKRKTDFKGDDIRAFIRQNSFVRARRSRTAEAFIACQGEIRAGWLLPILLVPTHASPLHLSIRHALIAIMQMIFMMIFMARRHRSLMRTKNMKIWQLRPSPRFVEVSQKITNFSSKRLSSVIRFVVRTVYFKYDRLL